MSGSLGTAAGLGAVTGLRSMQALAWVALELAERRLPRRAGRVERWLATPPVARALGAMAAGELVADKLPGLPARTSPGPLLARCAIGGLLGAIVVDRDRRAVGAAVGAAAALAGAFAGWFLRREAVRATMLPDPALALAEDAVAVVAARELAGEI